MSSANNSADLAVPLLSGDVDGGGQSNVMHDVGSIATSTAASIQVRDGTESTTADMNEMSAFAKAATFGTVGGDAVPRQRPWRKFMESGTGHSDGGGGGGGDGGVRRRKRFPTFGSSKQAKKKRERLMHHQRMSLSPFEKMKNYRRFPFKFIFNVCNVLAITVFFLLKNSQYDQFSWNTQSTLRHSLGNVKKDEFLGSSFLYNIPSLKTHVNTALDTYFAFPSNALHPFNISETVVMQLRRVDGIERSTMAARSSDGSHEDVWGKISDEDIQLADSITVFYKFESYQFPSDALLGSTSALFQWDATAIYNFRHGGGLVSYSIDVISRIIGGKVTELQGLRVLVLCISIPSLLLTLRALLRGYRAFTFARAQLKNDSSEYAWSELSIVKKLTFFNPWHVTSALGDIMVIFGITMSLAQGGRSEPLLANSLEGGAAVSGVGLFLLWISLVKYLEWRSEFYMLILSVKASIGRVLKFIVTVSPFFIGYLMLGVILFSDHAELFGTPVRAASTLFALLNGDSVYMVFTGVQSNGTQGYQIASQIYLYSFCIAFIIIILNVFIFIIESGYDAARDAIYGQDSELTVSLSHRDLDGILRRAHVLAGDLVQDTSCIGSASASAAVFQQQQQQGLPGGAGDSGGSTSAANVDQNSNNGASPSVPSIFISGVDTADAELGATTTSASSTAASAASAVAWPENRHLSPRRRRSGSVTSRISSASVALQPSSEFADPRAIDSETLKTLVDSQRAMQTQLSSLIEQQQRLLQQQQQQCTHG
eukprot:UC1_evm2s928